MVNRDGHAVAHWTLAAGVVVPSKGTRQSKGCRYILTQSKGVVAGSAYSLRVAGHTITVPRGHIGAGNLFIDLPHGQYTRLTRG